MDGNEIRSKFLEFFDSKDHKVIRSSPLIPAKDPTLLFVNAGMVQFKNVFLGQEDIGTTRAASSQKCLRVSGKHNDFENVGRTARHHTFFEMLGNFSFGDYFKKDAIRFAWEFCVDKMGLDPARLYATVFKEDDEAEKLWQTEVGLPINHIYRLGEKDNFWSMGDTGPCGPCTEIHVDQGEAFGCGRKDCAPGCDCDRYLEIWNLVFMQFNRDASGKLTPLPSPCVDTGMGLERLAAVMQGKDNNYDTDLFMPIHKHTEELSGKIYGEDPAQTVSMRVIADHIRAATFLIGDAVLPSNEGRGYVLRRILRRAARHGVLIELNKPFLYKISGTVIDVMKSAYPELEERRSYIAKVLKAEEERFLRTLENGLRILNIEIDRMKKADDGVLDGDFAFRLYDTYGFPLDLTEDIGRDSGFVVDNESFNASMERQRTNSAKAWKGSGETGMTEAVSEIAKTGVVTQFTGYDTFKSEAVIVGIVTEGKKSDEATAGQHVQIITDKTPFYAEMGGQMGDSGQMSSTNVLISIADTFVPAPKLYVHAGKVLKGEVAVGDTVTIAVDPVRRAAIQANHSATHLLHNVLRETFGTDVKQAGSMVAPDRLRFDFTYYSAIDPRELRHIETRVNELIRKNSPVTTRVKTYDEAVKSGAIALFGEKYADDVRVITMGPSTELCGGTHADTTGEIGAFVILSEGSVAAGVRRIEAITGQGAIEYIQQQGDRIRMVAELLKCSPEEVVPRTQKLIAANKEIEKKCAQLSRKIGADTSKGVIDNARDIGGVKVLAVKVEAETPKVLRDKATMLRDRLGSGILAIGADTGGMAAILVMVTDDLTKRFNAGALIRPLAEKVNGKGGGKPDLAQGGGPEVDALSDALELIYDQVEG